MSEQNKIAHDYVTQLDPTIQEIPRTLLISELISAGLDQDAPLILCLSSMDESSIDIVTLKGLTDPAPMELTEGDKKTFSSIMDPMLPEQKVLISMWKSQLSELELAHAHPFMQDIFNRPDSTELTREQVHSIALENDLGLDPLRIPKAALHAEKERAGADAEGQKSNDANEPALAASLDMNKEQAEKRADRAASSSGSERAQLAPQQPQPRPDMFTGGQGPTQGSSTGIGSIITDVADIVGKAIGSPFAIAKTAYNKANSVKISPRQTDEPVHAQSISSTAEESAPQETANGAGAGQGRAIAEEITALTQQLRENPSPETVESITEALSAASEKIGSIEDMSEDDEIALKEAMVSLKEASGEDLEDEAMSEEEKASFKDLIVKMTKALTALFAKLFGKNKEIEERIEPTIVY